MNSSNPLAVEVPPAFVVGTIDVAVAVWMPYSMQSEQCICNITCHALPHGGRRIAQTFAGHAGQIFHDQCFIGVGCFRLVIIDLWNGYRRASAQEFQLLLFAQTPTWKFLYFDDHALWRTSQRHIVNEAK